MTDLATLNERGLSLPTLREQVRDAEPEVVTNTRDDLAGYVELFRKQRDTEAMRELLAAQRVIEWEMAQRWPPNGKGAHRSDERPVLASTGAGADNAARPRVYVLRKHDPDELLQRPVDELSYAALRADPEKPVHVGHNSGNPEWYTNAELVEAARTAMGGIDLDPASSEIANRTIKADRYYTVDDDGLAQPWAGRVWMNPPYTAGLIDKFVEKLIGHVEAGDVTAAVVLTNNSTDTRWWQSMARRSVSICHLAGRNWFHRPDGDSGSPLQGQTICCLGGDPDKFATAFAPFGATR